MLFRKGSSPLTCQFIYNPVVAEIDQRVPEEDEMLERYQPTGPFFKKVVDETKMCGKMFTVR